MPLWRSPFYLVRAFLFKSIYYLYGSFKNFYKMLKLIYLSNGQQAYLVETLPNGKFLVDPIFTYEDHEGNLFDEASGAYRIEDAVFDKAPKSKIDTGLLELQLKLKDARAELSTIQSEKNKLQHELVLIKNQTNDATKWVFDLSKFRTAKRIVFFVEDVLIPIDIKASRRNTYWWSLHLVVSIEDKGVLGHLTGYQDGSDDNDYSKSKIDVTKGFYFDISDDEVMQLFLERLETFTEKPKLHWKHSWSNIPLQFRTPKVVKWMHEHKEEQRQSTIRGHEAEIERRQKELDTLRNIKQIS